MKQSLKRMAACILILAMMAGAAGCTEEKQTQPEQTQPVVRVEPKKDTCTDLGTPLADVRVRKALALAIDADTVIEALYCEDARKTNSLSDVSESWAYDPTLAKELLAEAGWPADYVLDVVYTGDTQTEDLLKVIGSYWEAIGIRAEFRKLEGDVDAQLWTAPEDPAEDDAAVTWDLAFCDFVPMTRWDAYESFASFSSRNSHTPPRDDLDDLIREAADGEAQQREAAISRIQQILTDEVQVIPVLQQNLFRCTSTHLGNTEKDILNWTTDREDETLYTNGGPVMHYCDPLGEPDSYLYQNLIFERLLRTDEQEKSGEGILAEHFEVSEDGLQMTVTLREDLFWQDGEALTAEDVKFTYELYLRCPDIHPVLSSVLNALEGARDYQDGVTESCSGIAVEGNTVTFRFAKKAPDALTVFSRWPVLPEHCLKDAGPENLQQDKFWKSPIGSGPYRVAETVMGEYAVLERWEDYRLTGEGNIQRIYLAASGLPDEDLVLRADLDMLDLAWGSSSDDAWAMEQMEGIIVTTLDIPCIRAFLINQFPHEPNHGKTE